MKESFIPLLRIASDLKWWMLLAALLIISLSRVGRSGTAAAHYSDTKGQTKNPDVLLERE